MARADQKTPIAPSILDRLLDDEPGNSREPVTSHFHNLRGLERVVARDLEALLNTRRETLVELPAEFTEVNQSLVNYGLPDFTSFSLESLDDRNSICRAVERAIADFEPRLQNARVVIDAPREHDRGLRFRVDALLRVDPAPEPVTFDAVLQLNTREYVIHGRN
jgi:type VI secretion system protein ImpF